VVLVAALGCGKKAPGDAGTAVVAKIGDRIITKAHFENRLLVASRDLVPDTLDLAGKRRFLQTMIDEAVMGSKARELQYGSEPATQAFLEQVRDEAMLQAALEEASKGKTEVTPAEVDEFARRQTQSALVKHLIVKTRRHAEELRQQILAGAPFDTVAARHTLVPRLDRNGEVLPHEQRVTFGIVAYGDANPSVEAAVFGTPVNQVSEPVQSGYGWHLFMPVNVTEAKFVAPDAAKRANIETQLRGRKRRKAEEDYLEGILQQHGFQLDEAALEIFYDKMAPDVPPEYAPDPQNEVTPVVPLSQAERARRLFDLDGKSYTLGDLSDQYDQVGFAGRPKRLNGMLGLRTWIRDAWLRDLRLERARKDGIDKLPSVVEAVGQQRDATLAAQLRENLVSSQAPDPTPAQLHEFFEAHKKDYGTPEQRRVALIVHPQEAVVRRAEADLEHDADFVKTAMAYRGVTNPDLVKTEYFAARDPYFAELAVRAFALGPGQRTDPFHTSQGWVIMKVDGVIRAQDANFDEVRDRVEEAFRADWSDRKLQELLAQWKRDIDIEVHDDVLERTEVRRRDVIVPGATTAAAAKPGSAS
jgi:parvulin-like peptidyl-prolyl isomerase